MSAHKGRTIKTTTSHLMCLGAILRKQADRLCADRSASRYQGRGRPDDVLDGCDGTGLAQIITAGLSISAFCPTFAMSRDDPRYPWIVSRRSRMAFFYFEGGSSC
ncbi:hypothetical protein SAMN02787142_7682 [Burkholderia sp. WP9]|uniref:hypothetical protein n=1 Tax=Burkholderia sp. WP9 TaxID=1500263 RepID=UPI00089AA55D|nr:hypothetical protein [Burkholderia sp. WP9]SEF11326.1 hypothetical protein SAMN02787142_7682 [Burkholderia sp. WP9]